MYLYIMYLYIFAHDNLFGNDCVYICYVYMYICIYVYVYMHICIYGNVLVNKMPKSK